MFDEEASADTGVLGADMAPGSPTGIACPQCGGVLWQQTPEHYGCHVGHRLSFEELMIQHYTSLQNALWLAIRALEERGMIQQQVALRRRGLGHGELAIVADRRAAAANDAADLIREVLAGVAEQPDTNT